MGTRRSPTKALVLQHIACEPPGVYEDLLVEGGWQITRVELDEGEPPPDWRDFDSIIAMGGPMSVSEEAAFPWLAAEKSLIKEAVSAGAPYWGICLGAQLLAASLGARVYEGSRPEVGLTPVSLTAAGSRDPVFGVLPQELLTFQWHGETYDLPREARLLASSAAYPNQAFRWRNAYGIQFHLEISGAMAEEWARVPSYVEYLDRVFGRNAVPELLSELRGATRSLNHHAALVFSQWLEEIGRVARNSQVIGSTPIESDSSGHLMYRAR